MKTCISMIRLTVLLVAAVGTVLPAMADDEPATAVAVATADPSPAPQTSARPLSATVQLLGGTELTGTLIVANELEMKTSFGEARIPLSEVAGIKLAPEGNVTTTVVMLNGDTITGATDLRQVNMETVWGKAEVNGTNISSILFSQGLKWKSEQGLSGTRWQPEEESATASNENTSEALSSQTNRAASRPAQRQIYYDADGNAFYTN